MTSDVVITFILIRLLMRSCFLGLSSTNILLPKPYGLSAEFVICKLLLYVLLDKSELVLTRRDYSGTPLFFLLAYSAIFMFQVMFLGLRIVV